MTRTPYHDHSFCFEKKLKGSITFWTIWESLFTASDLNGIIFTAQTRWQVYTMNYWPISKHDSNPLAWPRLLFWKKKHKGSLNDYVDKNVSCSQFLFWTEDRTGPVQVDTMNNLPISKNDSNPLSWPQLLLWKKKHKGSITMWTICKSLFTASDLNGIRQHRAGDK